MYAQQFRTLATNKHERKKNDKGEEKRRREREGERTLYMQGNKRKTEKRGKKRGRDGRWGGGEGIKEWKGGTMEEGMEGGGRE